MERYSWKRRQLRSMKAIFEELNKIPHETRKAWGNFGQYSNYDFCLELLVAEENRLDRANLAVKRLKTEERVKAKFG